MIRIILIFILLFQFTNVSSQDLYLDGQWQTIGPLKLPSPNSNASSKGIGPIEFIRTTKLQEGLILAGALNGGLFVTEDGGENWINAGSDYWTYSTVGWAEIHPENENIWVATSHEQESKSKPGRIGDFGGVYITKDKGSTWNLIGAKKDFNGQSNLAIYDMKFRPGHPNQLYVLTSDDIFYTKDCTAENVVWGREQRIKGMFYDLDFVDQMPYVAGQQFGKWHVYRSVNNGFEPIPEVEKYSSQIKYITLDKKDSILYILIDLKTSGDLLWAYNTNTKKVEELSKNQYILFGSGKTFCVNPHEKQEIIIGVGLRVKSWNLNTNKFERLGSDYHVDIEYVEFDPFDSNKIYIGTHGGVYMSSDQGKSWESKSNGLGVAEVLGMAVTNDYPAQVVIGTYHDGSMVYADWDKNGQFRWENVNGGDALIPLINPNNSGEVYTSNQYSGGGIYYSSDTAKSNKNIHSQNGLKTSGWEMAACLHPTKTNYLFFNYKRNDSGSEGNMDIVRTIDASKRKNVEVISDFKQTHQLGAYKVYSLMNSKYHPDILLAYVLHFDKDENGKSITRHRIFRTLNCMDSAGVVVNSWHELDSPKNDWMGDAVMDKRNYNKIYFSYVFGDQPNIETPNDKAMVFYSKFNSKGFLKKQKDISINIPSGIGGRYNMEYTEVNGRPVLFVGNMSGIYLGTKKTLKGKVEWRKVGFGLPHCKVYGIHYNEAENQLTVGLKGRGVWQLNMAKTILVTK